MNRVGIGYDSHRFEPPGPLILGGVSIPSDVKLHGHSDGDAAAHALTDAILGAAGMGDIGALFPDTEQVNAGRDSIEMLGEAVAKVKEQGWSIENADLVIVTEYPRIAPHKDQMRSQLARALGIPVDAISIKGKSNEGMGWIGRGEGLACVAIASLTRTAKK